MITPPLGRFIDTSQQLCTYSPGDLPVNDCGQPATWHILWDTDWNDALACDEHMTYAQQFAYADRHPVGADCSMPGSLWYIDENRCGYPGAETPAVEKAAAGLPGETA